MIKLAVHGQQSRSEKAKELRPMLYSFWLRLIRMIMEYTQNNNEESLTAAIFLARDTCVYNFTCVPMTEKIHKIFRFYHTIT